MKQRLVLFATAALLLLIFVGATQIYQRGQAEHAVHLAQTHADLLVRPHAPVLGAADAPVTVVEFFDPVCATCAAFHAPVKDLVERHPGQIRLVLRWAPFQVGSEQIVALLEAARRQDRLWPVLDVLMETQDDWKPLHEAKLELVWRHLDGLGLDLERLRRDMADPEIAARIKQDEDDAATLAVETTPTFYVNGQPLPGFGFTVLKQSVEAALKVN